jgi:hypothetical protein
MKSRLRVVLLSLTALLAIGSFQAVAAGAAPSPPHFEERVPQTYGFKGGAVTLEGKNKSVRCKTITGPPYEWISDRAFRGGLRLQGCTGEFSEVNAGSCNTAGAAAGEIVLNLMAIEMFYLSSEKHEVALLFSRPETGLFATVTCPAINYNLKVKGSFLAQASPVGVQKRLFGLAAKGSKGVQELTAYEGLKGEKLSSGLEVSLNGAAYGPADLSTTGFELEVGVATSIVG